ncbi:RDD family protein [Salibacterium salarium]|uniref:RDD family protein n=1 Tax=Salibacterium salarium TaxID=284579 RepID=A0A3R9Q6L6_9BACI|nr:RDD family protein [Salibacterium salarium]RSL34756.1 RDD family protein [Salibacterium salarium]
MEDYVYSGFWIRLLAFLLDSVILTVPFQLFSYIIYGTTSLLENQWLYVLFALIGTLYMVVFPVTGLQATPGKVILKMKIVNKKGDKISILAATGRYIFQFLSFFMLGIGFIMIVFRKNSTGLHDLLARTYVINRNQH